MNDILGAYREGHFSTQDGLRLFYRDYGDPYGETTPVLCLSGLSRNSHDFDRLARRLCPDRRVISLDFRGRGRSQYDNDWTNYHPQNYVNDVRLLLTSLNVHKAVFIGTSMGGLVTMGMATAFPGFMAGAVLNDVGPDLSKNGLDRIIAYHSQDRPQNNWAEAIAHLKSVLPTLKSYDDDDWDECARGTFREAEDGRLHFDWDVNIVEPLKNGAANGVDLWPMFRCLNRVPVLSVRGALSDVLSADTLHRMHRENPAMNSIVVDNIGHNPRLIEPDVLTAIHQLLQDVD